MNAHEMRRLERFDRFARDVRYELEQTEAQMQELREAGKVRSATYQQLFANRAILVDIVRRLNDAGL